MHKNADAMHDYANYVPIKNAVKKLQDWKTQGAEISYLTSRKNLTEVGNIKNVLNKYDFPDGELFFRKKDEEYHSVAERVAPDILIEDDCESIGGIDEMTITHVNPAIKAKIKSIPVREFGGIDHLPNALDELLKNW